MSAARILDLSTDISAVTEVKNSIAVGREIQPVDVVSLAIDRGLRHVVQRESIAFESEFRAAQLMLSQPHRFLRDPVASLSGERATWEVARSPFHRFCMAGEKKTALLSDFEVFLQELPGSRAIREDAIMIADELYTNASKNALPLSYLGDQVHQMGTVEFIAHTEANRLFISCIDSFGTLDSSIVLKKIRNCYLNGVVNSINLGPGGAGIGSYMVFNACISMYIAVEPGKRTVVCCALPLSLRLKQVVNLPKNLHILLIE